MSILELSFASGESSLSVRKFAVHEAMSELFSVSITARSPNDDIELESIVGQPAMFRIVSGLAWAQVDTRLWTGLVSEMELLRTEPTGLSTYELTIVPNLWMLTQRKNYRLFQHKSVPEIAGKILDEWRIAHELRIERERYPKLELRVQYGESDHAFLSRLLEEAGVAWHFEDDLIEGSRLVLHDRPHTSEARHGAPIPFLDDPTMAKSAEREFVTEVRLGDKVRPGKLTIRDFDFRRPGFALFGESPAHAGIESKLEQYHYQPGAFLHEGHKGGETPTADDKGVARSHHPSGHHLAGARLEGHRATKQLVHFATNAMDLHPGVVFHIGGHARRDLSAARRLLVNSLHLEGEVGGEQSTRGTASFADVPYRPALRTDKPRIHGVQSAIVVGPKGEAVHTDEFGRVRVQFHWDREGRLDEHSSIWIRVSQAWAGPGYGMINLPRVGHEVLVAFVEGDPDNPIIVGRVFNGAMQVPYKLPNAKLWSAWKSDSHSNIILFVDEPGEEGFLEQAERDRVGVVKNDQVNLVGGSSEEAIFRDDGHLVGGSYERGVVGGYEVITGGEYAITTQATLSQTAGFEIAMRSGYRWEAGVRPLLPFIFASLAVGVIRQKVADAFPAGPPDLMAILQEQATALGWTPGTGLPPGVSVVPAIPAEALEDVQKLLEDFKGLFSGVLAPILALFGTLPPATIQAIFAQLAQAPDLATMIALLEAALPPPPPGGATLGQLMADLTALFDKLMAALPSPAPAPGSAAPIERKYPVEEAMKKLKPVLVVLNEILDEIAPDTSVRIEPTEIRITTRGATIELKGDDIEIKAKGSIKIEGESVEISPSPCKHE